ncbi:MAG: ATP-binding protein [Treponema sp.]|jgi:predicted AAA+ superfamily ATPase|nr:ATP-binding protein [Treponema sp.]
MYIQRTIEKTIKDASRDFPVLLLTGMRQVGKSWVMEHLAESGRKYVSLDDLRIRELAKKDPEGFIQEYPPPVIIDEIQYAPELFTYIKIHVDSQKSAYLKKGGRGLKPQGLFWLTGSQKFRLMEGIQESLAGRVAVLDMLGLSYREKIGKPWEGRPFLPSLDRSSWEAPDRPLTSPQVFKQIWNGFFPELAADPKMDRTRFYESYIQTYIARDVRDFYQVRDELAFFNFLTALAARTGELLNYHNLAGDAGIDGRTAKLWLAILERSGIIQFLRPYHANITKRVVKAPKVYFLDTGLAAYLARWNTAESLATGAQKGAMLETWVFAEILKSYWHNGAIPNIYFYRDTNGREIDFLIEQDMTLYPIEVKKTAMPRGDDVKHFKALEQFGKKIGPGAVLCLCSRALPLADLKVLSMPVWEI